MAPGRRRLRPRPVLALGARGRPREPQRRPSTTAASSSMPLAPGGSIRLRVRRSVPIASKPLANSIRSSTLPARASWVMPSCTKSGNPVRVGKRTLGIERHCHPRASLERSADSTGRAAGRVDGFEALRHRVRAEVEVGVVDVRVGCREAQHPGPLGSDQNRRPLRARSAWCDLAVSSRVETPLEVHVPLSEQGGDDLQCFLQPPHPPVERIAECTILRLVPARADAQHEAACAHLIQSDRHLREQGRVAEAVAGHEGAQLNAPRRLRESGEHRPGLPGSTGLPGRHLHLHGVFRGRFSEEQMVGHEQHVEADPLGHLGHLPEVGPARGSAVGQHPRAHL